MNRKSLYGFILSLMIICSACTGYSLEKKDIRITRKDGSSIVVKTELARTEAEQQKGYMGRKHIPGGTGMLFIFDRDQILSFWMKNTPTALSIAYIDSRGIIREIYDMTPFSLASVKSTVSVRYALEVPQGWFAENNIEAGCTLSLP
ncbi:DUF192 domain-containing protein [Treponema sp. OMZ 840]|uniref:DUF192 domain-containing protein n=1 Tax=Treponema sp. OMZ 840 TaxID=244313 RepID=UPI003D949C6E